MNAKAKKMTQASISKMSFEEAISALEDIVKRLESGSTTLDTSIDDYNNGILLKNYCSKKLTDAKLKIETITNDSQALEPQE